MIRYWVSEFDVDGIRLDAADVLDFDFMRALRRTAEEVKPDFWLMGEVIHGDYSRWVNGETLHSVTNYALHKALYSGHNDHNYFEIAHTVKYLQNMGNLDLYNFVDNHDVERIYTKLSNKAHFTPVHILLYTLPGVPSIYYGSEFGIEGRKERSSDDSLRPALNLEDYESALSDNPCTALIAALGKIRQNTPALSYGNYTELQLTNRQFAFARDLDSVRVIVTVNNDDNDVRVGANTGEIWVPSEETPVPETFSENKDSIVEETPVTQEEVKNEGSAETKTASASSIPEAASTKEDTDRTPTSTEKEPVNFDPNKAPEDMSIEELQAGILAKMANNGPVTDQMKKTVYDNIWHDSLVNWLKSFC